MLVLSRKIILVFRFLVLWMVSSCMVFGVVVGMNLIGWFFSVCMKL